MELSKDLLLDFLIEAHHAAYLHFEEKKFKPRFHPGFEDFVHTAGDWRFLSSSTGGEKKGGEEVIYLHNKPVWIMNYYSFIIETDHQKTIFRFLHDALNKKHSDLPVRGAHHKDHLLDLRYEIDFDLKDIFRFRGTEYIYQDESLAYECFFHGGLINN